MPKFKAGRQCFHEGNLVGIGDVLDYSGQNPRPDWKPMDKDARDLVAEAAKHDGTLIRTAVERGQIADPNKKKSEEGGK